MSAPIVLALRLIAAAALYAFLGWALYALWQDVRGQGRALASRRVPGVQLTMRHERGETTQKYFFQPKIVFGRDPGCDIYLADETVSTVHAQLTYHHNQWWLEDLASTNGTMLNDAAVKMPTVITSGDEIQCGATRLAVAIAPDAVVPPTQKVER